MSSVSRPISLIAERAVRLLRERIEPVDSLHMAAELLATRAPDEPTARQVLEAAFNGDARLIYEPDGWKLARPVHVGAVHHESAPEPDRVMVFVEGAREARGKPFRIRSFSALRLRGDEIVASVLEDRPERPLTERRRSEILTTLRGAAIVIHDPPGALRALELWLGEALEAPISLRRLAQHRLGLRASHDLDALGARLNLTWRTSSDPLERADMLDACLHELRGPNESLYDLRLSTSFGEPPLDWSRFAFDRRFLQDVPQVPGTYRFYDAEGTLLYVGKSRNLQRRLSSYFREGQRRQPRLRSLLDRLHRIEYDHAGSELEAMLREAETIRREQPVHNVQRAVHPVGRSARLESILILEPAEPPSVLRAFLIHRGRLVGRVAIGPRGGGLRQVERILQDSFFFVPDGPTPLPGADLDVEVVARWLAKHRDRVVAFDPTQLCSATEVCDRLRWFLDRGGPWEPDGTPIVTR